MGSPRTGVVSVFYDRISSRAIFLRKQINFKEKKIVCIYLFSYQPMRTHIYHVVYLRPVVKESSSISSRRTFSTSGDLLASYEYGSLESSS